MPTSDTGEIWAGYDLSACSEEPWDVDLGDTCAAKVVWTFSGGLMVKFAVTMVAGSLYGEHNDVVRADPCHCSTHIHKFRKGSALEYGRQELAPLNSINDVGATYPLAFQRVVEDWDQNFYRWEHG